MAERIQTVNVAMNETSVVVEVDLTLYSLPAVHLAAYNLQELLEFAFDEPRAGILRVTVYPRADHHITTSRCRALFLRHLTMAEIEETAHRDHGAVRRAFTRAAFDASVAGGELLSEVRRQLPRAAPDDVGAECQRALAYCIAPCGGKVRLLATVRSDVGSISIIRAVSRIQHLATIRFIGRDHEGRIFVEAEASSTDQAESMAKRLMETLPQCGDGGLPAVYPLTAARANDEWQ